MDDRNDRQPVQRIYSYDRHIYQPTIQFKRLNAQAIVPSRAHASDVGWDLAVYEDHVLEPLGFKDLSIGIAIALPEGYWARITNRSSTKRKWHVDVFEGVLDQGYTGEIFVGVQNMAGLKLDIPKGTRLAQLIIHKMHILDWEEVEELPRTDRGSKGFGSTGK